MLLVKNRRSNSVLYELKVSALAKELGISDGRTVKKYLTKCLLAGLCFKKEQPYNTKGIRTVYKFISYEKALLKLLGIQKGQIKLFPLHKSLQKFKDYQYQIEKDLVAASFSKQAFRSNSNFPNKNKIIEEIKNLSQAPVSEKKTRIWRKRMNILVKKLSSVDIKNDESQALKHIKGVVTGCNHIAKQIGKSGTTGNNRILKWATEEVMKTQDIVYFYHTKNEIEAYNLIDCLKQENVKGIFIYSKKERGVKCILGKKVLGFQSANFQYKS